MQTTMRTKRFDPTKFKTAALAVGIAASVTVGTVAFGNIRLNDEVGPATGPHALQAEHATRVARFYDMKLARQEAGELHASALAARVARQEQLRLFLVHKEQQFDALERTTSPAQLQFIEQNTQLPEAAPGAANTRYDDRDAIAPVRQAIPNYRLLDQNVLPGDDARPSIPTRAYYWLLDQNVLPGDDTHLLPYGEDGASY